PPDAGVLANWNDRPHWGVRPPSARRVQSTPRLLLRVAIRTRAANGEPARAASAERAASAAGDSRRRRGAPRARQAVQGPARADTRPREGPAHGRQARGAGERGRDRGARRAPSRRFTNRRAGRLVDPTENRKRE